jgi:triosephosphate isomerase
MNKKIIIANWKLNPIGTKKAKSLFSDIKKIASKLRNVQTVICPPFLYINDLQKLVTGHRVVVGAQDAFFKNKGAYTGEVSTSMLKDSGVKYIIIGHSERRALGETNEIVNKKVISALKEDMNIVVCIGEKVRDENAEYLDFIKNEIKESLLGVQKSKFNKIIIAYEPIWAIGGSGGGIPDSPSETMETILFIRKILSELFGKKIAMSTPVLYGGSVNRKNAKGFLVDGGVQGLLVGGASLDAKHFGDILKIADKI